MTSLSATPTTGLGPAIRRRIVESHGGRIGVGENPGGGSVFWFTVPAW
ncbi:ATP-binding protein [Actinoplanes sp. G11-F43]